MKENGRSMEAEASTGSSEDRLLDEIKQLKRRLHDYERADFDHASASHAPKPGRRPSAAVLWTLALVGLIIVCVAFFAGYLPRSRRESMLVAEAKTEMETAPTVNVVPVARSSSKSNLVLPGNIEPVAEAPILARASGYIKRRFVDIGDRVKAGQIVAEIDSPEIGQQIQQARANVEQVSASLEQATANLQLARTNAKLARVTAGRYESLVARGAVSKQENDVYQAQSEAQLSNVQALEKAVTVARSNIAASQANLARLTEMQKYLTVRAPFAGVITLRNIDAGALVTEGSTLLFRVAQNDQLRTYINVPQADAVAVHVGQAAVITVPNLPSRHFSGTVARTSNSLDPGSRTLLVEIRVANTAGLLLPGMYAQVDLMTPRTNPPLLIPADTLVVRANGPQVAVVNPDSTVHFQRIQMGRDYGEQVEVLSGLQDGERVIVNPGDRVREHVKVNAVLLNEKPAKQD